MINSNLSFSIVRLNLGSTMHTVNTSNEANYRIVKCQNPLCNLCTRTVGENGTPPSPVSQGIIVYTCSNPSCSLCDGDYSLLLDIVSPSLAPSEDCFIREYKELPRPIKRDDDVIFPKMFSTVYDERQTNDDNTARSTKRKLSGHLGYATKSRRHSTSTKLFSDDVDIVDENQLMSLAMELELDKIQCLPDLQKDVITTELTA